MHSVSPSSFEEALPEQLLWADAGDEEMDLKSLRVAGSWVLLHQGAWLALLISTAQACHGKAMDLMTRLFL